MSTVFGLAHAIRNLNRTYPCCLALCGLSLKTKVLDYVNACVPWLFSWIWE